MADCHHLSPSSGQALELERMSVRVVAEKLPRAVRLLVLDVRDLQALHPRLKAVVVGDLEAGVAHARIDLRLGPRDRQVGLDDVNARKAKSKPAVVGFAPTLLPASQST